MNELKLLPRDEKGNIKKQFTANGIEYTIRNIDEVLSPTRYLEFNRFSSIFAFGLDFKGIISHIAETQKLMLDISKDNSLTKLEPLLKLESLKKAILENSQIKFESSMYLCAIFITTKDEDLRKFDLEEQTKKIENWTEEGFKNDDFLLLASLAVPMYLNYFQSLKNEQVSNDISLSHDLTH